MTNIMNDLFNKYVNILNLLPLQGKPEEAS